MEWGSPEQVLAFTLIGMGFIYMIVARISRVRTESLWLKHGPDHYKSDGDEEVTLLRQENARLSDRIEAYEDRVNVLERIVTDSGYNVASEIEALRDRTPRAANRREAR